MEENTKKLPKYAVYSEVVNAGLILPYKRTYTFRDFKKLCAEGYDQLDARWIVLCSWAYWCDREEGSSISKKLTSLEFRNNCMLGLALM